jgi:hypothetical protein
MLKESTPTSHRYLDFDMISTGKKTCGKVNSLAKKPKITLLIEVYEKGLFRNVPDPQPQLPFL